MPAEVREEKSQDVAQLRCVGVFEPMSVVADDTRDAGKEFDVCGDRLVFAVNRKEREREKREEKERE